MECQGSRLYLVLCTILLLPLTTKGDGVPHNVHIPDDLLTYDPYKDEPHLDAPISIIGDANDVFHPMPEKILPPFHVGELHNAVFPPMPEKILTAIDASPEDHPHISGHHGGILLGIKEKKPPHATFHSSLGVHHNAPFPDHHSPFPDHPFETIHPSLKRQHDLPLPVHPPKAPHSSLSAHSPKVPHSSPSIHSPKAPHSSITIHSPKVPHSSPSIHSPKAPHSSFPLHIPGLIQSPHKSHHHSSISAHPPKSAHSAHASASNIHAFHPVFTASNLDYDPYLYTGPDIEGGAYFPEHGYNVVDKIGTVHDDVVLEHHFPSLGYNLDRYFKDFPVFGYFDYTPKYDSHHHRRRRGTIEPNSLGRVAPPEVIPHPLLRRSQRSQFARGDPIDVHPIMPSLPKAREFGERSEFFDDK